AADHADRAALQEVMGLDVGQRQTALQEDERRRQWLGPFRKAVVLDEGIVMAFPEEDVVERQLPAQFLGTDIVAEERRRLIAAVVQLPGRRSREHLQELEPAPGVAGHQGFSGCAFRVWMVAGEQMAARKLEQD